mgnify:CR=1 FL=1
MHFILATCCLKVISAFLSSPITKAKSSKDSLLKPWKSRTYLEAASPSPFDPDSARTLYDILGAKPEDSTSTLRKKYLQLARASHPDAQKQNSLNNNLNGTNFNSGEQLDFTEIAAAWTVLSNERERRRYGKYSSGNSNKIFGYP